MTTARLWIGLAARTTQPPEGPDHRRLPCGDWQALALDVDPSDAATEPGLMGWAQRQNAVLSGYAAHTDVLPVPLGAVFADDAGLAAHINVRRAQLRRAFADVAGHAEYLLSIDIDDTACTAPPKAAGGAAYLGARRDARDARRKRGHARQTARADLLASLGSSARDLQHRAAQGPGRLLDVALLVARPKVPDLLTRLERSARTHQRLGLSMALIGPCPAYSFATTEAANA